LNVRYLPNLDGKTKFVDLGTHIFVKHNQKRPIHRYQFWLSNVINSAQDDDLETYMIKINQGIDKKPYFMMDE